MFYKRRKVSAISRQKTSAGSLCEELGVGIMQEDSGALRNIGSAASDIDGQSVYESIHNENLFITAAGEDDLLLTWMELNNRFYSSVDLVNHLLSIIYDRIMNHQYNCIHEESVKHHGMIEIRINGYSVFLRLNKKGHAATVLRIVITDTEIAEVKEISSKISYP
ncbi:MAG: hypothetical protein WCQ94_00720 [Lachnospiraceae bacterium]